VNPKRIVVVGAGPAGMMSAIAAGQRKQPVILIEKNSSCGKKLLLSGKGRCNLTNICDLDAFIERFSAGGAFLRDAFKKFFHPELMRFFQERGLKLKVERQLRVFPLTDRAVSVLNVLKQALRQNNVNIMYNCALKDILVENKKVKGVLLAHGKRIPADRVILATGGLSYSFTGSTGEGIELARKLGHRVIPFRAGLVPLEVKQAYPKLLKGLALKNIRLKFTQLLHAEAGLSDSKSRIVSEIGELLFTDFGISGPLVLSLSAKIVDWLKEGRNIFAEIDLKPALSEEQLDNRLLREFRANPRKSIKNVLKEILPTSLINVFLDILKIAPDKKANQITQQMRQRIIRLLKGWRLDISGSKPIEEGMVTRGGISLKDINPRTMESRLIKGLYFAGEMIDVDADTGGFNLQAAFSTGYLAGESAALN
jgi:predicted Rossmann fold flavoprotein